MNRKTKKQETYAKKTRIFYFSREKDVNSDFPPLLLTAHFITISGESLLFCLKALSRFFTLTLLHLCIITHYYVLLKDKCKCNQFYHSS